MADCEVNCINKPDRDSPHEHITHIGYAGKWRMTREEAVRRIKQKIDTFFVIDKRTGTRADVGVVEPAGRPPHLRTYADRVWNDNLLAQQECGSDCKLVG
jgi:hypothetical protein